MASKTTAPANAEPDQFITDAEGAKLLKLSLSRFFVVQKEDPSFPPPVWLGPRCKRHVRSELLGWALSKRERVAA